MRNAIEAAKVAALIFLGIAVLLSGRFHLGDRALEGTILVDHWTGRTWVLFPNPQPQTASDLVRRTEWIELNAAPVHR